MASDDLLSYHCSSSVQSFDRLFTSGSMHLALGVTHCSWKLASVILFIRLRIVAYEQKTCGAAHLNCDQKIYDGLLSRHFEPYSFLSIFFRNRIAFHCI